MSFYNYMSARRNVFTTYHGNLGLDDEYAYNSAVQVINGATLDAKRDAGLRAELDFYHQYRYNYSLTLAEDCGDSCDFSGRIGDRSVRFDVTTNTSFKRISHFTKPSCVGSEYLLAVRPVGAPSFQIAPVWNLGAETCPNGHMAIPMIVIYPEEVSRGGTPDGWNLIKDVTYCPTCFCAHVMGEIDDVRIPTLSEHAGWVDEYLRNSCMFEEESDLQQQAYRETRNYLSDVYHYLKEYIGHEILAIGEHRYITTERDGGGHYGVQIVRKSPCVDAYLPDEIELDDNI